jgi:hypothetical protein
VRGGEEGASCLLAAAVCAIRYPRRVTTSPFLTTASAAGPASKSVDEVAFARGHLGAVTIHLHDHGMPAFSWRGFV